MWLINSSIGRKVVMSVTGIALILFLTFHCAMNIVALFSGEAYNMICELLGANWYAVVATLGLAALAVIHIVFAFILTAQNRTARGKERYAVTDKPEKVEWASQNMLVLGCPPTVSPSSSTPSATPSMQCCMSSGFVPSGSTSPMVSGLPCRHWVSVVRSGSTAGASSVSSMSPC